MDSNLSSNLVKIKDSSSSTKFMVDIWSRLSSFISQFCSKVKDLFYKLVFFINQNSFSISENEAKEIEILMRTKPDTLLSTLLGAAKSVQTKPAV